MMDAISDPAIEGVVIMSSAQVGKTEALNNVVAYFISQDPSPILVMQPTLDMAQAWSKDRLAPMLRDTPCLAGLVKDPRSRDSGNTTLHKQFPGGHVTAAGANSPSSLASRPIRVLLADEVDRYPASAGTEGDPVNLARARLKTFWNRKYLLTSTPTIAGKSRIEAAMLETDWRRWEVPCQECGHRQFLEWENVQWSKTEANGDNTHHPETARYHCAACAVGWTDQMRWWSIRRGRWVATRTPKNPRVVGFHLSEMYSPWVRLGEMATAFLEAVKSPVTLQTFVNTSLGQTWSAEAVKAVEADALMARRETYAAEVPDGVVVLTAGVDVQDSRLEATIVGHGVDGETWILDHIVIMGDPALGEVWSDLDTLLLRPWHRRDGMEFRIQATAVDSGGHHTQRVYEFCRQRAGRRVWAIKGQSSATGLRTPIWPRMHSKGTGKVKAQNYPVYMIGVDAGKDALAACLAIEEPGPAFVHFPAHVDRRYFDQLLAEQQTVKIDRRGHRVRVWELRKGRIRNEALDCLVYAMAALEGFKSKGYNVNRDAKVVLAGIVRSDLVAAPAAATADGPWRISTADLASPQSPPERVQPAVEPASAPAPVPPSPTPPPASTAPHPFPPAPRPPQPSPNRYTPQRPRSSWLGDRLDNWRGFRD